MRLASTITPVLAGISTLYSPTNNMIVSSFTPSSSNNVVSRRRSINYSSNTKNEIHDGSAHQLTVHDELDTISSITATTTDTQSQQQNVADSNNSKNMNRRQLLKQCTISSLLGFVQLSSFCNEARAEVETLKDTDVDASTLPKEATTELTKSTTDTDTADNIESKSDEIKESTTEVKSETAAPATNESSTTSTKVEVVDKKQESNKKEVSEEYKAMKSIVDTYKSSKSSSGSGSKSKVAVGSTTSPPTATTPSDALTSVITKDLSGFILPATLLAGSATIASSILSNGDELNGEKSILSTSVKDQANEMTRKNIQRRSEWKMDTPTPYGLQDGSPKQLVPPKGSDWERIDNGSVAGSRSGGTSGSAVVEEKKPIEPSLKGSMPKPTEKVKAQKSISMAKLVKEGTTTNQKQKKQEWKGIDKPTPYGLKSDTPKYASPNESSKSENFGEKALAAVSASKTTTTTQPLKGSATSSSSGNISMSNIVKGTEDPTQVKKKVLTLDNKGRKVWKLESASSWIQTLATGGNSSKQKGKDWKGLPPSSSNKGEVSSGKGGTNKEEVLLSVAEKKAAMKKDVQRSISGTASPPPVSKVKATKSISMAKIVKGAATSPPPAQQQSMFNSLPTKGSSAKAPVKKSFAKTTLKGAMKAAQSAIDSGTSSSQQQPTPEAKSPTSSGGDNGPVQALPTPSYSAKSNIMGGSSDNVVPVRKSFAKGSFKMKSSTPVSDNKMSGSSTTPVSAGGMGSSVGTSSSSSTAAPMPSNSVTMKGSETPPSPISSGSSSDVPVKKNFSKSSFKKSSTGKGSPGGWAVSSSPIESSISTSSAMPVTPVAKQAAPVSLPPPPAAKGTESSSPTTQGLAKPPVSAVKKSYGKSSFKGSSSSGGAGGMLKGSSSQLFGSGPTPKSSSSFGKSVTNKKKATFGKSISMANVMKQGSSTTSGGGDDGFLSSLEQSSVPPTSSSSTAASPNPSSNAAVLLPKQVSTSDSPPPQVPKVETPQVTSPPKVEADQASNQVRQPPAQMPPPLGQIGNSEASGVRIGSANRFGNTQPATFAAPVNRGRQQQQQQQAQTSAVAEKENKPRQAAQSVSKEETQSAPAVTTVTITDPRTGKKRTITTSSNIRP